MPGTLSDGSPLVEVTLRDEALGVGRNESMFITVRLTPLSDERLVPCFGMGANDTVLVAGMSAVFLFSVGLTVMRGSVLGLVCLSAVFSVGLTVMRGFVCLFVKTSDTLTSASRWLGNSSVKRSSLLGSRKILLSSSMVACSRSNVVATGSASLPGIHVALLTIRDACVSGV